MFHSILLLKGLRCSLSVPGWLSQCYQSGLSRHQQVLSLLPLLPSERSISS
nr:MAG TPA: hypothetical protein [Caudoviricetes sp.]